MESKVIFAFTDSPGKISDPKLLMRVQLQSDFIFRILSVDLPVFLIVTDAVDFAPPCTTPMSKVWVGMSMIGF